MSDLGKTKSRREFLKDGLRAALLGGFAFAGVFLSWRGYSNSEEGSSCLIDLPCRSCSKLPGCKEPRAVETRQKPQDSRPKSIKKNKGA